MSPLVPIALYGWPFAVIALFAMLRPRWAVIASFLFAWLFLPMATFEFQGLPGYGKMEATTYGVLVAAMLFDGGRLGSFRPSWLDLPMVIWCTVPMASSVTNGLGAYDGLSAVVSATVIWGLPYFIGRLYFSDLEGLRDLAAGIVIGGLIYMPLCWWEIRMSPRLHLQIYGFRQHSWLQHVRSSGYRPMLFMQHGLAVGLWMATATLVGFWLWMTGALKRLWSIPMAWLVPLMGVTTVLCRSFGAIMLLVIGVMALSTAQWTRRSAAIACLILLPILYMGFRAPGIWDGSHLLDAVRMIASEDRAGSLEYRLRAENILAEHALRQPIFGWGGWGRNRPADMGHDVDDLATDGLWVIALGTRGVVGLAALVGAILLPAWLLWRRMPSAGWWHPVTAPAAALAMLLVLFMIDSLFNAMVNPIFTLAAGGLSGLVSHVSFARRPGTVLQARRSAADRHPNAASLIAHRL